MEELRCSPCEKARLRLYAVMYSKGRTILAGARITKMAP